MSRRPSPALAPLALALLALAAPGCRDAPLEGPTVTDSAEGAPRTTISLNRTTAGFYRTVQPFCVGQQYTVTAEGISLGQGLPMRPGDVAEFRNYLPDVPSNVTGLDTPVDPAQGDKPMFSPNLVRPYNTVREGEGEFSFWRYQFPRPGPYEFFDTNMGEPGRKIVDSYYGTVSFVGESDAPKGMVCVDAPGCSTAPECAATTNRPEGCCKCIGVCCTTAAQCTAGNTCHRGRCVSPDEAP